MTGNKTDYLFIRSSSICEWNLLEHWKSTDGLKLLLLHRYWWWSSHFHTASLIVVLPWWKRGRSKIVLSHGAALYVCSSISTSRNNDAFFWKIIFPSISENNVLSLKFRKNILGIMTNFWFKHQVSNVECLVSLVSILAHRAHNLELRVFWTSQFHERWGVGMYFRVHYVILLNTISCHPRNFNHSNN